MLKRWLAIAAAVLLVPASASAASNDMFRGKTITYIVATTAGGGYDTYGRILAQHMSKHIPGKPTIIINNMPGAGSLKGANYIYNVAPKDGTAFAIFARGIPMEKLLGRTAGHQFDATKFTWIGSITDEPSVCAFWHQSAIHTWEDMKSKTYKLGGSGLLTDLDIYSNVLRNMFHLPGRLISGFPGGADVVLAMQRREVDGRCGWSWSSLSGLDRQMLIDKLVTVPLQLGVEKIPELPDVPHVLDLTNDPKEKAALRLIFSRQSMARPFAAPPGLPPERAKALRDAFDATMKDPAFLADMARQKLEVRPVSGAELDELVRELYSYPADVVKIAADAIKPPPR
jgi:tripartite-type tricarboxylate transporter receptor subunit TctC